MEEEWGKGTETGTRSREPRGILEQYVEGAREANLPTEYLKNRWVCQIIWVRLGLVKQGRVSASRS